MVFLLAALIAGCRLLPEPPPAVTPLEKGGRHLLLIAEGCGCHGQNFAGWKEGGPDHLPRTLPFGERFVAENGAVPASNVTSDPATGIGDWSDTEIERALRDGVTPGGRQLAPVMPFAAYQKMSRQDMAALIAYLRRLTPVKNAVPPPDNIEMGQKQETGQAEAIAEKRPVEKTALGAYLVHAVSGCANCHAATPNGPLSGKILPVGREKIVVPNITPDVKTGIGRWSEAEIARYLRTGRRPDKGLARSLMAGLIVTSYRHFTAEEANAIAAYLKSPAPTAESRR